MRQHKYSNRIYPKIRDRNWFSARRFKLFLIGYPRDSYVNYVRFDGFFRNISYNFSKLMKSATYVFAQRKFTKDIFNSKFVKEAIIFCARPILKLRTRLLDFLNCSPPGPIIITKLQKVNWSKLYERGTKKTSTLFPRPFPWLGGKPGERPWERGWENVCVPDRNRTHGLPSLLTYYVL